MGKADVSQKSAPPAPQTNKDGEKNKQKPSVWLNLFYSRTPTTPINVDI